MALAFTPKPTTGWLAHFWGFAQYTAVVVTVLLLAGLFVRPLMTLDILWNVVIPLLPATFLISTAIWRSVCPLATLNMATNGLWSRKAMSPAALRWVQALGIVLLIILVPARRFLFNEQGVVLAVVIIAVAVNALVLGAIFDAKAGFCNAFCPVLPVEKMYGQHPLWALQNPRCPSCTLCTSKGCIDLSPSKSIKQAVGPKHNSATWLMSPFGAFTATFPGFVVGYFTTQNVAISEAGWIYLTIALWAAGSFAVVFVITRLMEARAAVVLPMVAALAVGLYYLFASPNVVATLGGGTTATLLLRSATFLLVVVWLWRALRDSDVTVAESVEPMAVPVK